MTKLSRALGAFLSVAVVTSFASAHDGHDHDKFVKHSFKKEQLSKEFFGEGANFGDVNHDGASDMNRRHRRGSAEPGEMPSLVVGQHAERILPAARHDAFQGVNGLVASCTQDRIGSALWPRSRQVTH